jgi:hypothetical protein
MSAIGRLCCKSLFGPPNTNLRAAGAARRKVMWGESSANDGLIRDFRGGPEGTSIGNCRSFRLLAGNWRCSNFGVLQHNRPLADELAIVCVVRFWGEERT